MSKATTGSVDEHAETEGTDSPFPPTNLESGNPLPYRIIIAVLLIIGVAVAIYAWNLGTGSLRRPDAGLWIFIVSCLIVLSIPAAYLVREQFEVFELKDVKRSIVMVAGLVLFVVLYPLAGFYVAGLASLIVITRWSAQEGWRSTLIISLVTPAVLYLLFGAIFQVSLSLTPGWV